ncbi:calpain-1 catalytic subunit-like [Cololabis saira]|uniref:calpain-1 catalytic subunit-like n=1 Tax=Cololabis saira TaxID=129043 RepID=UPI002AD54A98|nr:calpain-1 catalytic subunit-like [Cololabis saira]
MSESGTCTSIINLRYPDGSEGSATNPTKFKNQDYAQLKDYCAGRKRLFIDSAFPPDNRSLGDLPSLASWQEDDVKWLRPADILKMQNNDSEPSFCLKGASRFDFGQGSVGNCWFLAAIDSLTFRKELMAQVMPMDQSFKDYDGIFHFRFWRFGKWVDVVIDDYLPTYNKRLLSVYSKCGNEFWVPLLEKAFAKVCGSYADMNAGLPVDACKDFSGGVTMTYDLGRSHYANDDLWLALTRASGCRSMICCGTASEEGRNVNTISQTGLVDGHAYSVTKVTEVEHYGSKVRLVRLMNPWGKQEWKGKWSDNSDLWKRVSPEDREKCLNLENGEFWMELGDFCHYFSMVSACCENPNFIDGDYKCQWKCMTYDGKWVAGRSAGGSPNDRTFYTNPQFRIQVKIIDKTEPGDKNMLLSLMQKPEGEHRLKKRFHPIGVVVYKVPAGTPQGRLRSSFFKRNSPIRDRLSYSHERDVIVQYSVEPGEYVVVPSTIKPYMATDFVLTVYTKAETTISHYDGDDDDHHDHDHDDEEETLVLPEIPTKPEEEDTDKDSGSDIFNRYADQSGELTSIRLQRLLNDNFPHGTRYGFGLDTCRSFIATVDFDHRLTMTTKEFSVFWKKMNEYKDLFRSHDVNRNGSLSESELEKAIDAAAKNVSSSMVRTVNFRYSSSSSTSLEDFITIMFRLDKMSGIFKEKSSEDGMISLNWDEWFTNSMYN